MFAYEDDITIVEFKFGEWSNVGFADYHAAIETITRNLQIWRCAISIVK